MNYIKKIKRKVFRFWIKHNSFIRSNIFYTFNYLLLMYFFKSLLEIGDGFSIIIALTLSLIVYSIDRGKIIKDKRKKEADDDYDSYIKTINEILKPISKIVSYSTNTYIFEDELYQKVYDKLHKKTIYDIIFNNIKNQITGAKLLYDNDNDMKISSESFIEYDPVPNTVTVGRISSISGESEINMIPISKYIEILEQVLEQEVLEEFEERYENGEYSISVDDSKLIRECNEEYIIQLRKEKINYIEKKIDRYGKRKDNE